MVLHVGGTSFAVYIDIGPISLSPFAGAPLDETEDALFTPTGTLGPFGILSAWYSQTGPDIGLTAASKACGFTGFDWQQTVTSLAAPSGFYPYDLSLAIGNGIQQSNISPDNSLQAGPAAPPFSDPPLGGYTYEKQLDLAYPFYWRPNNIVGLDPCTKKTPVETVSTLLFQDCPATNGIVFFETSLVGVLPSGMPSPPLFTWTWESTFDGTAGGIKQLKSAFPPDPGSGTGGVTITSINGVQLPPVVLPSQVAITASGLAYSRVSQTFNGTVTVKNISSSAISGPLQILFTGITPGVTMVNATNNLSGTPYLTVPILAGLLPGQSATVTVKFTNPSNATINFTPAVYSGSI